MTLSPTSPEERHTELLRIDNQRSWPVMYAYVQDVPIDEELYGKVIEALGPEPLASCVRRSDAGLRHIDVGKYEADCARASDQWIHPAVNGAFGGRGSLGEPEVRHLEVLHASGSGLVARTQ